jgi:sugar phosphate isomerase/epimerase
MARREGTTRREFAARSALAGASLLVVKPSRVGGEADGLDNPFFAMDTGTPNGFTAAKIAMLADVGYTGVDFSALAFFERSVDQLSEALAAVDGQGLDLYGVYLDVFIDGGACPPDVGRAIELTSGREKTVIWAALRSANHEPGSPSGDDAAVATVRSVADQAAKAGLRVALYPHTDFYAERVADNVRLAERVDRDNVGVTWNLCHWLKVEGGRDFDRTAARALPHLLRVTVSGADVPEGDLGWDRLIQPLDSGTYDVYGFVKKLRLLGYEGPIGLQGFGIGGDHREVLTRSLAAWEGFRRRFAEE